MGGGSSMFTAAEAFSSVEVLRFGASEVPKKGQFSRAGGEFTILAEVGRALGFIQLGWGMVATLQ